MKMTYRDSQVAVIDDVLPKEQFHSLWQYLRRYKYRSLHQNERLALWGVHGGEPLVGESMYYTVAPPHSLVPPGLSIPDGLQFYPARTELDHLVSTVVSHSSEVPDLVGKAQSDWISINFTPYANPVGVGLGWHYDDSVHTGSYIYYAHPEWSMNWGGELMVGHAEDKRATAEHAEEFERERGGDAFYRSLHFGSIADEPVQFPQLSSAGWGHFFHPNPNRLIFLSFGASHSVVPVSKAAGNHVRVSISGFFLRPSAIPTILRGD